jgi:hypothetical protein
MKPKVRATMATIMPASIAAGQQPFPEMAPFRLELDQTSVVRT